MSPITEPLFSVDDHLIEKGSAWQDRVPAKLRDRAPRLVSERNEEYWVFDGERVDGFGMGLDSSAGRKQEDRRFDPQFRLDEMRPGCYDAKSRLPDMDLDGVAAQVLFPSALTRNCGARFILHSDKELALACTQAYNDYILEEWTGTSPERFLPAVILPLWDADLAAKEVYRTVERGAKTLAGSEGPHHMGFPPSFDPWWDPLWSAISEVDIPVCAHIGSSARSPVGYNPDLGWGPFTTLVAFGGIIGATELLWSPLFERWPNLHFVIAEGGIGWVPYVLERSEYTWRKHRTWTGQREDQPNPVDVFRKHISVCFIDDRFGIENRHHIGVDRIMWEGDYPHPDGTWPQSRELLSLQLKGCTDDEIAAMTHGNAERVFRHPLPDDLCARLRAGPTSG